MPENKRVDAAAVCEAAAAPHDNEGGSVSGQYDGPERRAQAHVQAREPLHWYQTIGNNISQWLAIGGAIAAGIVAYGDFQTKSAVRDALIQAKLAEYAARDDRIEESLKQIEVRRVAEKQEFASQINGIVSEIRSDIRLIRERLDRGR